MATTERRVTVRARSAPRTSGARPLLGRPRPLLAYMAAVAVCAGAAGALAIWDTPFRVADAVLFAGLVTGASLCVEAMRRLGTPRGMSRDLFGAWWLPVVLLLPPAYAALTPVPVYLLLLVRMSTGAVHPRVFSALSASLSGVTASWAFHAASASAAGAAELSPGVLADLRTGVLAVLCCVLFTALNTLVIAIAVQLSGDTRPWKDIVSRESLSIGVAEICVGLTVFLLAAQSPMLLAVALPPVLLLQRSLIYEQLQSAARLDNKTGLLNAATWEVDAGSALDRALRHRRPAALLLIDIDHFKRVNDTYGHLVGDTILAAVAHTLGAQIGSRDVIGRFGGEEFVVLLHHADMAEALRIAERLRYRVSGLHPHAGSGEITVTVSIGVALAPTHGEALSDLLGVADLALYRAKDTGRNRVRLPLSGGGLIPGQVQAPLSATAGSGARAAAASAGAQSGAPRPESAAASAGEAPQRRRSAVQGSGGADVEGTEVEGVG